MQIAQRASSAPVPPLRGEDHEVERARALHFEPRLPAAAGRIDPVERLGHDALVARGDRSVEERRRFIGIPRDDPRHHPATGHDIGSQRGASRKGLVEQT